MDSPQTSSHDIPSDSSAPLLVPGAVAGFLLAILFLPHMLSPYRPYDGIIGPPAFLDFSVRDRFLSYLLLTLFPLIGGIFGLVAGKRAAFQPPKHFMRILLIGVQLAAGAIFAFAALRLYPGERISAKEPKVWGQLVVMAALSVSFGRSIQRKAHPNGGAETSSFLPLYLWFLFLAFHLWVVLQPVTEGLIRSLMLSFVAAAVFAGLRARSVRSEGRGYSRAEQVCWWLFALCPILHPTLRVARALELPWGMHEVYASVSFILLALLLLLAWLRSRAGQTCRVNSLVGIPFSLAVIYASSGGTIRVYDFFHQGEFIYTAKAMSEGLKPFKDIFLVHGFGFNFLPGWIADEGLETLPNLDMLLLVGVSSVAVGLMAWFYLRAWGTRWILPAILLALGTVSPFVDKGGRFIMVYAVLALLYFHVLNRSLLVLAAAGAVAALGLLYSMDTGAAAVLGGVLWSMLWGFRAINASSRPRIFDAKLLLTFCAGGLIGAAPILVWFASMGVLDDFFASNAEYARIKLHYDSRLYHIGGMMYFVSPLATILGGLAVVRWYGRSSSDPTDFSREQSLRAIILFLTLTNALIFSRGLDRADAGHIIYASTLAWPLLGSLIVWRSINESARDQRTKSLALALSLIAIQWVDLRIVGDPPIIGGSEKRLTAYPVNCRLPVALPPDEFDQGNPFFSFCRQLDRMTSPGDYCFDMTSRPALYHWTSLRSPTRYFALSYASGISRQSEVIESLESTKTPWVIFPPAGHPRRRVDQIDIRIRNWLLCDYVFSNYRALKSLEDGSILMERLSSPRSPEPPEGQSYVRLGWIPRLWGRSDSGVPSLPATEITITDWFGPSKPAANPPAIPSDATELWIEFEAGWSGSCIFLSGFDPGHTKPAFEFNCSSDFPGPYRIPTIAIIPLQGILYAQPPAPDAAPIPRYRLHWWR